MNRSIVRIALVIPRSGSPGIYGPSCRSCVELAVGELNACGGINGRTIDITLIDGAQRPQTVADAVAGLIDAEPLAAVIGMHDSEVRRALIATIGRQVPYVYAANYEGEQELGPAMGVGLTGEQQIGKSIGWLAEHRQIRTWCFVGNDYVWPRGMARVLTDTLSNGELQLLRSDFVPMGTERFSPLLRAIEEAQPDAVFTALVGADAVAFNRQFVRRGLDRHISRFLPLFEENSLLAVGTGIGRGAYTAGAFFVGAGGERERLFQARYDQRFGAEAPQLNGFAVACYEATMLLATLLRMQASLSVAPATSHPADFSFAGVLGNIQVHRGHAIRDVLLAEAAAGAFEVRAIFPALTATGEPFS